MVKKDLSSTQLKRYLSKTESSEGGLVKILGVLFVLIGIYALLNLYNIFSLDLLTGKYILIGCAIGAILGGLYMIGKSSKSNHKY